MLLMKQCMTSLPKQLLYAARIVGASELGVFWRVVILLNKPALAVLKIFSLVAA